MTLLEIENIMRKNKIIYSVVTNLDNGLIETIGNSRDLIEDDLVTQLFGDFKKIKALNDSLEGQIMPQIWSQGVVKCIVCKPNSNIIIGLLYNENRPPLEAIDFIEEINDELLKNW